MGNLLSHPCVHPKNGQRYNFLCPIKLTSDEVQYFIRLIKPKKLDRARVVTAKIPKESVELLREHRNLIR